MTAPWLVPNPDGPGWVAAAWTDGRCTWCMVQETAEDDRILCVGCRARVQAVAS